MVRLPQGTRAPCGPRHAVSLGAVEEIGRVLFGEGGAR
jgi:hypothetical protein